MKNLSVKLVPCSIAFLVCLFCPIGFVLCEPVESNAPAEPNDDMNASRTIYDQRQTGKYNIHVSIKDVAIIDVDQNGIEDVSYDDDDYYYDEGHLTIKPILLNPNTTQKRPALISTTPIPTKQTSAPNSLASVATSLKTSTTTLINQNSSSDHITDITTTPTTNNNKSSNILDASLDYTLNATPASTSAGSTSTKTPTVSSTVESAAMDHRSEEKLIPSSLNGDFIQSQSHPLSKRPNLRFVDTSSDSISSEKKQENDSNVFKFKIHRGQKQSLGIRKAQIPTMGYPIPYLKAAVGKRCRRHQFRDASGECRSKRSSSILKKLFHMLVALPFPNDHTNDDRDNE